MDAILCMHCGAPARAGSVQHGRFFCEECKKWSKVERPKGRGLLYVDPPPRPKIVYARRLEQPTRELPAGMVGMGWRLIEYDDGTMFAVSSSWGCTRRLSDLEELIEDARKLVRMIRYVKRKQQEEQANDSGD